MSARLIRIAVLYLVVGILLGLYMGITQQFTLVPVHAHLLLAGWASLALAGIIYHLYPAAGDTRLALVHFWLHNIGLPVFMIALAVALSGHPGTVPIVAAGATALVAGLVAFAANVLLQVRSRP